MPFYELAASHTRAHQRDMDRAHAILDAMVSAALVGCYFMMTMGFGLALGCSVP